MRTVPIELGQKTRSLRFDLNSSRQATMTLQRYMPDRADKLKLTDAASLILQNDQDAIVIFLMNGLSHQDRTITQRKVEDWMQADIDDGRKIAEFSMTIIDALEAAGLVEVLRKQTANGDGPAPEDEDARLRPLVRGEDR